MIVDRIFGVIAAAGFALGVVGHVELLRSASQRDPLEPLFVTVIALTVIAYGYATLRAERREGLIDAADESLDLVEVAFSLPRWVIAVSAVFAGYIALLIVCVHNANLLAHWPDELSLVRQGLKANGLFAAFVAALTLASFIVAAFFLIREPVKELR